MDLEALDDSDDDLLDDDDDDEEDFSLELSTDDSNVCEFTVPVESTVVVAEPKVGYRCHLC